MTGRRLTERQALADIYEGLAAQLRGGDLTAQWAEGWLDENPGYTQSDFEYLTRVASRVANQLARKAAQYATPASGEAT